MERKLHGYLLHSILNRVVGPMRSISWGVLYPLIHELEENGYIEQAPEGPKERRGKKKKTYQVTEDGKERFKRLMEEPIEYKADYELHFYIKMANFDHVSDDVKIVIYYQYLDYLKSIQRYIDEQAVHVAAQESIPESEKYYLSNIYEHRRSQNEIGIAWVTKQVEAIKEKR